MGARTLSRSSAALPVRTVHLGLGAFHRAHQAYYTDRAGEVGIAAFTGRRPDAARVLAGQDGLYTLLVRGPDTDSARIISSISACHDGADVDALRGYLAEPTVGSVTLTITEAGYQRGPDGRIDAGAPDIDRLRRGADPVSAPGRLLTGLDARRRADAGPIAVVPCDNLPGNGAATQTVIDSLAQAVDPGLAGWISDSVVFVSTMVDRITPATVAADRDTVTALTGMSDAAPVVTEPFTEWVLADVAGGILPDWGAAGAQFVPDVSLHEKRKLWLLNGSHSLLAYAAPARGHRTVAAAIADPVCRGWVQSWWDAACAELTELPAEELTGYRQALLRRYENPRIAHLLDQIAADGSQKLPIRIFPVLRARRAHGELPEPAVLAVAGWISRLRAGHTDDPRAAELTDRARGAAGARAVLAVIAPDLATDDELVTAIGHHLTG